MLALEFNRNPVVDEEAAFDIFPSHVIFHPKRITTNLVFTAPLILTHLHYPIVLPSSLSWVMLTMVKPHY